MTKTRESGSISVVLTLGPEKRVHSLSKVSSYKVQRKKRLHCVSADCSVHTITFLTVKVKLKVNGFLATKLICRYIVVSMLPILSCDAFFQTHSSSNPNFAVFGSAFSGGDCSDVSCFHG